MSLDPALDALRRELERAGQLVVPHGDHICVRLPLFASIRVRLEDGRLRLNPRLGPVSAGSAVAAELAGLIAVMTATFAATGLGALSVGLGFAGLAVMITEVGRFLSTETSANQIRLLWAARVADRTATGSLGAGSAHLPPDEPAVRRPAGAQLSGVAR